jgi:5'-deoxynucleotidase YfbR-like HD superfamily hydrolase
MQTKATNPISLLAGRDISPLIEAFFEFAHLKQLYRQGWLKRGVPPERCESVAEHSLGVAVLAMWLGRAAFPELDVTRLLCMALIHDFGEIYTGDLIPTDAVNANEKHRRELASIQQVLAKLPHGEEYIAVWEEFERGESPEARFIRQLDRLEMGFQAAIYGLQGLVDPAEFMQTTEQALSDPRLRQIFAELVGQV